MITQVPAANFPLTLGSREEFARSRRFFQAAGYEENALCRLLGTERLSRLPLVQWDKIDFAAVSQPLRFCVEVFLRGKSRSVEDCLSACGAEAVESLRALGLLRPVLNKADLLVCPVWLYPADGFLCASDRQDDPDGRTFTPAPDIVFPAIYDGTLRFLGYLPDAAGKEALDLCGGCGIGALHFSRNARSAVTADITERSTLFAEFNGHLNDVPVESLCGDLYEPVNGRKFDIISAHPPFVPEFGEHMVYRDAGETGEDISRRIIEALPHFLREGGSCVVQCIGRDTHRLPFEKRVLEWLGAEADHFEIVWAVRRTLSVDEIVESIRARTTSFDNAEAGRLRARLNAADTHQFLYGVLFLHRLPAECPSITGLSAQWARQPVRLRLGLEGTVRDFERLLKWRERMRQTGFNEWLHASRPALAPGLELNVRHLNVNGELVPAEFVFSIQAGFETALKPDAWVVPLVARLDGKSTVSEIYHRALNADELPAGFPLEAFADLVTRMIDRGFLVLEH